MKTAILLATLTFTLAGNVFASEYNCKEVRGGKLDAYLVFDDSMGALDYSNVLLDGKVMTEGDYEVIYSDEDTVTPKMNVHLRLPVGKRFVTHTLVCKEK